MPLTRGRSLAYDHEQMAFKFEMLDGVDTVECQVSAPAMDELAGGKGTLPSDREAQFLRYRGEIEHIASAVFDEGAFPKGAVVCIFWKHVRK
jgi:hypothetical protein